MVAEVVRHDRRNPSVKLTCTASIVLFVAEKIFLEYLKEHDNQEQSETDHRPGDPYGGLMEEPDIVAEDEDPVHWVHER